MELSSAEDRERHRLAEILHDDLQQVLAGAAFHLEILQRKIGEGYPQAIGEQVASLLQQAMNKSRNLSHELSPPTLKQQGLISALRWLAGQMENHHGLAVQVQADPDAEPRTEPVKPFVYKAVREMLFNVVKHAGVANAKVELRRDGDYITAMVTDEGKGFEVQQMLSDESCGGLGLFSIRERVELLSGQLRICSQPGEGTTLALSIPDHPPRPTRGGGQGGGEHGRYVSDPQAPQDQPSPATRGSAGRALRVLLVDDHHVMREGLSLLLSEELDFEVVGEANNGKQAVDLVHQLHPDVVIMDVSMPVMSGIEATRTIREQFPDVRVVGLSMYDQSDLERDMVEAGAEAYLPKSGPSSLLLAALRGRRQE